MGIKHYVNSDLGCSRVLSLLVTLCAQAIQRQEGSARYRHFLGDITACLMAHSVGVALMTMSGGDSLAALRRAHFFGSEPRLAAAMSVLASNREAIFTHLCSQASTRRTTRRGCPSTKAQHMGVVCCVSFMGQVHGIRSKCHLVPEKRCPAFLCNSAKECSFVYPLLAGAAHSS